MFRTLMLLTQILPVFVVGFVTPSVQAAEPRQVLIYQGPGVCEENCAEVFVEILSAIGLPHRFVGPDETDPAIFKDASVWIQPGGKSVTAANAMAPELKANLRKFVEDGGGYAGFCAGGYFATAKIGTSDVDGLGIFPGQTAAAFSDSRAVILASPGWGGSNGKRFLYWEGGPHFSFIPSLAAEALGYYPDGRVAAARATYGKGRVFVVGPHPEAPLQWRTYFKLEDDDGMDWDLVQSAVLWASGQTL